MKFTSELIKKSWAVYRSIKKNRPEYSFKFAWREAIRQTIRAFNALKTGILTFVKLNDELATRNVASLDSVGYTPKKEVKENSLFVFADLDKYRAGESNYIISCNGFQIV